MRAQSRAQSPQMARSGCIADAPRRRRRGSTAMARVFLVAMLSVMTWNGASGFTTPASSAEAWRVSRQRPPRWCRASRSQRPGRGSLQPVRHSLRPGRRYLHTHAATKRNRPPSVSPSSSVEELLGKDPPLLEQPQPPPKTSETRRDVGVGSGEEGVINGTAAFALDRGGRAEEPSPRTGRDSSDSMRIDANSGREGVLNSAAGFSPGRGGDAKEPSPSGQDSSVLRQMSVLVVVAGLAAVVFDYEHGMAGFYWFRNWVGNAAPHSPVRATGGALGGVHFTPLKSLATGLGAGFTRAASRTLTFPLDTLKTRSQVSRLGAEDRASLPLEMRTLLDTPATVSGVFRGFPAFLFQAGPANAVFFLCYDALNALGAAALLPADIGGGGGSVGAGIAFLPTVLHLGASSLATVPANLVRTPAEVVKQRLQVGQENGNSLQALQSILRAEGVGGLFVGGREQLIREIPFNAIQFTVYECLKSSLGSSELWADAALGAASSALAAVATQPVDTVKTRVMTKSVPGVCGGTSPGFLKSAALVSEAEGASSLMLGMLPRLVLVSTGGAFYFWGQELVSSLLTRAGL